MVSCLMGDSTALASAIVRCCPKDGGRKAKKRSENEREDQGSPFWGLWPLRFPLPLFSFLPSSPSPPPPHIPPGGRGPQGGRGERGWFLVEGGQSYRRIAISRIHSQRDAGSRAHPADNGTADQYIGGQWNFPALVCAARQKSDCGVGGHSCSSHRSIINLVESSLVNFQILISVSSRVSVKSAHLIKGYDSIIGCGKPLGSMT